MSGWNPFSWDFWTGGTEPASPAAAQQVHQQVLSNAASDRAHQEVAQRTPINVATKTNADTRGR